MSYSARDMHVSIVTEHIFHVADIYAIRWCWSDTGVNNKPESHGGQSHKYGNTVPRVSEEQANARPSVSFRCTVTPSPP